MTRDELDAKLEAVEARNEVRYVDLSHKLDKLNDTFTMAITGDRGVLAEMRDLRFDNKATRTTIIATGVATALAIIAAIISIFAFGGDQFGAGRDLGGSLGALEAKMDRIEAAQADAAKVNSTKPSPASAPK